MKRNRLFCAVIISMLVTMLGGCKSDDSSPDSAQPDTQSIASTESAEKGKDETDVPEKRNGSTLMIYMCGSNLESQQGLAGKNIDELLSAEVGDDFNIVIQTGGAKTWKDHDISNSKAQRYLIKNGELQLIDTFENKNMGDAATLADFLAWGQENYFAQKNMLLLWDHGGGAVKGVCFDENYGFDSLTLTELKTAFENAELNTKFDMIGFDACLMASVETSAVLSEYSDYMIASEEIEPADGWNYKVLAESFSTKDDLIQTGRDICDSFIKKCEKKGKADISTLSLIDLTKIDPILERFDNLGKDLSDFVGKDNSFSKAIAAAKRCEKFGYESVFSGSSNMIDFLDFGKWTVISDFEAYMEIMTIVEDAVVYKVNGESRDNGGLSFFYPIDYDADEISDYISLGISSAYNDFLSTYYLDVPEQTITFSDKGSVADNGAFKVTLSPESSKYLSTVTYDLIEKDKDGTERILFSDMNMKNDWTDMTFSSDFKGTRLLYNGQPFYYTPLVIEQDRIEYTIPAFFEGKTGNMRYYLFPNKDADERYYAIHDWSSSDGEILSDQFYSLEEGDVIQVAESLTKNKDGYTVNYGDDYTIKGYDDQAYYNEITEIPLSGSTYYYVFVATDIFGNKFYSDIATLEMTKSYDELSGGPLPDGEFAAKVTNIEPYTSK